ncbi:MAG: hypothetical protein E7166_06680 [Firmicutes bacterium]|nr:hypothetical protein [Bacillota bacterium]
MTKRKIKRNIEKNEINYEKQDAYFNNEVKHLAIIVGIVLAIFSLAYLIIGIFVTKEINWFQKDNETTETTIQYTNILAGETFNQKTNEYYVIFSNSEDNNYSTYEVMATNNSDKNIYLVDLANPLNQKYISEESNVNAQTASELKVKSDTLIKVSNKSNVLYLEGKDNIINQFK